MSNMPTPNEGELPASVRSGGVGGALDEKKRAKIVALLSLGCSRRSAARYVGCSPSTIGRTVARDPEFADQLAQAEQNADIDALRMIRRAAGNERYWRAAAWLLERRIPEEFALRHTGLYTGQQIAQIFQRVTITLRDELPEEKCRLAMQKLDAIMEEFQTAVQTTGRPPEIAAPMLRLVEEPQPPPGANDHA